MVITANEKGELRGFSQGNLHIMPTNDLRDHVDSTDCWCKPTQDDENSNLFIHHSMDRREEYEDRRKMS